MNAVVLFTVEVFGVLLRVLECHGKRWLLAEEVAKVFEYRSAASMSRVLKPILVEHTIKARIHGAGQEVRIVSEAGLNYLCGYSPRQGAASLRRWLAEGGLQAAPACSLSSDEKQRELVDVDQCVAQPPVNLPTMQNNTAQPTATKLMLEKQLEREKAYCRDLLKTLLRYCDLDSVDDVRTVLDDQIDSVLRSRHCPGLNAARYALYCRYWVKGKQGDSSSALILEVRS